MPNLNSVQKQTVSNTGASPVASSMQAQAAPVAPKATPNASPVINDTNDTKESSELKLFLQSFQKTVDEARKKLATFTVGTMSAEPNIRAFLQGILNQNVDFIVGYLKPNGVMLPKEQRKQFVRFEDPVTGLTPLHITVLQEKPNIKMIKTLVECGARVQAIDKQGFTPALYALFSKSFQPLKFLLSTKAINVNAKCISGRALLHISSLLPSSQMTRLLLSHGADANLSSSEENTSPLQFATDIGSSENVRCLLQEKNLKLNHRNIQGQTALSLARLRRHPGISSQIEDGISELTKRMWVAITKHSAPDTLKEQIETLAELEHLPDLKSIEEVLMKKKSTPLMSMCVSMCPSVESSPKPMASTVSSAASAPTTPTTSFLAGSWPSTSTMMDMDTTTEVFDLLEQGADPSKKNKDGMTALHLIALRGNVNMVEAVVATHPGLLLERSNDQRLPLDFATLNQNKSVSITLLGQTLTKTDYEPVFRVETVMRQASPSGTPLLLSGFTVIRLGSHPETAAVLPKIPGSVTSSPN